MSYLSRTAFVTRTIGRLMLYAAVLASAVNVLFVLDGYVGQVTQRVASALLYLCH